MYSRSNKNKIWHLSVFLIFLTHIAVIFSSMPSQLQPRVKVSDLFKTCAINNGVEKITELPQFDRCTAIAKFSSIDATTFNHITLLRGNAKFVYVIDSYGHKEMVNLVAKENAPNFCKIINNLISDHKIDAIIFDNLYPVQKRTKFDDGLQQNIYSLFISLKMSNPYVLFGLAVPNDKDLLTYAFNLGLLDTVVDVWYAKTYNYYDCAYHNRQAKMPNISPTYNMRTTVYEMNHYLSYPMHKTIIDIQVIATSVQKHTFRKDKYRYFSYGQICSLDDPDPNWKYCEESLSEFYQKGTIVNSCRMAGAIIHSLDFDDTDNSCHCGGSFPIFKCISAGLIGAPSPQDIINCLNFGKIVRDQINRE